MRVLIGLFLVSIMPAGSYAQAGPASHLQDPAAAAGPAGQTQPQTVVKSSTRLVAVDVVATDSKGAPVTDLKDTDFIVLEDGRQQRPGSFSFQRPGTASVQASAQLPQNVVTNAPRGNSTSLNIILLDRINGESRNRVYAQDRLVKYLESGNAIQPTAVYVLEKKLLLVHDFTSDTRVLKDALNNVRPSGVSRVVGIDVAASPYATVGDFHTNEHSIQATLSALKLLAKTLAGYPGRKNLIWVSEAFPVSLTIEGVPQGSSSNATLAARAGAAIVSDSNSAAVVKEQNPPDLQEASQGQAQAGAGVNVPLGASGSYAEELARIADALMDAHVALYPIDAAGMGQANRIAAQSNMRDMADRTGGRAFYNRNDIEVGIGSSIDDGSTYYSLSYYPDNKVWDGRFRRIEIKTSRPGVTLRYRLGYYALDPEASAARDSAELTQEFAHAMTFDAPLFAGLRFQASVVPPADKTQKVTVNFAIDPHTITFEDKGDGLRRVSVSCSVSVYNDKGGPVKGFKEEVTTMAGTLKPDEYRKMMQGNFPCRRLLELKPGNYVLRLGAVDRNSRALGTASTNITIN
ncbi:MAG TPA: VWA domain-containing protein [Candidatus Saccharimonadales bacterium]|nr:VWA domain-containing protein [Candidatus Saccharimonadales bacterium]